MNRIQKDEGGNWPRSFKANGTKYIIRTAEEGIGIRRYSNLLQMSSVVTFDMNAGDMTKNLLKLDEMLNQRMEGKNNLRQLFLHIQGMLDGIGRAKRQWHFSLWMAALFIVKEDEDLTKFVESEQSQKIEDWNKEGLHEQDFFFLCQDKLREFSPRSPKLLANQTNSSSS